MKTNPEIEAILQRMCDLCCETLRGDQKLQRKHIDELVKSLSVNGWERHSDEWPPLTTILKDRIKASCMEPAMHRGASIDGVVLQFQQAYEAISRIDAATPGT